MKAYIIDDEPHVVKHLCLLVTESPGLHLWAADTDPLVALNKILTGMVVPDIIFLDIDMPGLGGLEFARQLPANIAVVFITAHASFALDAFDIGAADYLLKPIDADLFLRAVDRAKARIKHVLSTPVKHKRIFVRLDSRNLTKVRLKDIIWIEADDKRMKLHTKAERPISILRTLNNIEAALPETDFVRIHKSYIVNIKYIGGVVGKTIVMNGGQVLNIGTTYSEALYRMLRIV